MYYAHSGTESDKSDWQTLRDHLEAVAGLTSEFAGAFGCGPAGRVAGLLHDVGKYTAAFQSRLEDNGIRVDHSTAGAAEVLAAAKGKDRAIAELIAYAIAGHHAGLPDRQGHGGGSLTERLSAYKNSLDPVWSQDIAPGVSGLFPAFQFERDPARAAFQFSLLGRMMFSCLVDADYRDTEAYYARIGRVAPDRHWQALPSLLPQFSDALQERFVKLDDPAKPVNAVRRHVLEHVRSNAKLAPGLFTLTVPTGGGKTLASLAFAVDHARLHGHRRIIYAIPFTSIIDQTAAIFRELLGESHVLEHHSAFEMKRDGQSAQQAEKLRAAMENWAAPVVVTTNVQFFESLFAAKPSAARKLHNIAGSVIILDEAQTLPRKLLAPCARALDELARNFGCSIVLCTATQPALDSRNFKPGHAAGLPLEGRELAPDPGQLATALRRVTIRTGVMMTNDDLAGSLQDHAQALVIVNSRKHALDLYNKARENGLSGVFHLSTRQYAAHRQDILRDVRKCLAAQEPCRVIATSLIEAGVDIDFPRVWRAEAGLDQIAQAAGRCNREGRKPAEHSIVTIFASPDYPPPPDIKALSGDMSRVLDKHASDILSPEAMTDYFGEVYWRVGDGGLDAFDILGRFKLEPAATDFAYRSVAADFRMIESGMEPVIVPRDAAALEAVGSLVSEHVSSGSLARNLQRFTVQVPPKARQRLITCGHVSFHAQNQRGDQFAVLDNVSLYRPEVGLVWEDSDYLTVEQSVI